MRFVRLLFIALSVAVVAVGCGPEESDDSEGSPAAASDLQGHESVGVDSPADSPAEACDCGGDEFCLLGECFTVQTRSAEGLHADPREAGTAVAFDGDELIAGVQLTEFDEHHLHAYRVGETGIEQFGQWDRRTDDASTVASPVWVGPDETGDATLGYGAEPGAYFAGGLPDWEANFRLIDFDVIVSDGATYQAITESGLEARTAVRTVDGNDEIDVEPDVVDSIALADVDGDVEVYLADHNEVRRATKGLDAWTSERVGTLTSEESSIEGSTHRRTVVAGADGGTVHLLGFQYLEDETGGGGFEHETVAEYIRVEDGETTLQQTLGTGQWKSTFHTGPGEGSGIQEIARDVRIDGDGNAYVLVTHLVGDEPHGHRRAELVKVSPGGEIARGTVANWSAANDGAFDYALDVSPDGEVAVAAYEEQADTLHVRRFAR